MLPALAELIRRLVGETERSRLYREDKWKDGNCGVSKKRFVCSIRMKSRRKCRSLGRLPGGGSSEQSLEGGVKFALVRRA